MVTLGADLALEAGAELLKVLRKNEHIFAWGTEDIPVVARETIKHCLMFKSEAKPKKQKLCRMSMIG